MVTATNTLCQYGVLSRHTSSGSVLYAFDSHGNVVQRLSISGSVLSTQYFDAFGNRQSTDSNTDPYAGFGGQAGYYTDWETGTASSALVLLTYRFYDPSAERFLTRDPISYNGGINLYECCGNGPTTHSDQLGLTVSTHDFGIIGCLGFLIGWILNTVHSHDMNTCELFAGCMGAVVAGCIEIILDASPYTAGLPAFLKGCIEGAVGSAVECLELAWCECGKAYANGCLLIKCLEQAAVGCLTGAAMDALFPDEPGKADVIIHKVADGVEEFLEGIGLWSPSSWYGSCGIGT